MNDAQHLAYEYQVGGSLLLNAPSYVQRQADQDLYEGLQEGDFCYVLNSRQMGKSSLRVQVMARLQAEGYSCVSIQTTDIIEAGMTSEQWYAGVVNSIVVGSDLHARFDDAVWWASQNHLTAVQRFSKFVEEVLLVQVPQNIVIFIDEVDRILSVNFSLDSFFAVIRECYNKRAHIPAFRRLTFTLIGVATPSDLIRDERSTPFNIGRSINLTGFNFYEARPLAKGLVNKASNPEVVLQQILYWTAGQPFLTQKLCNLVQVSTEFISSERETEVIEALVRSQIIERWQSQDEPPHLRTIRDRLLRSKRSGQLLGLYNKLLHQEEIQTDASVEQIELRLSGLVVEGQGQLKIYNPIYAAAFDRSWVEENLAKLRPYAEGLTAWLASDCRDRSRLLQGPALQEALAWADQKSVSDEDNRFLRASQTWDRQQEKIRRTRKTVRLWVVGLIIGVVIFLFIAFFVGAKLYQGQQALEREQKATKLEQQGIYALQQIEISQVEALVSSVQTGRELKRLVPEASSLKNYPAVSPLLALQAVLDNIRELNRVNTYQEGVNSLRFSKDGKQITTAGEDGTIKRFTSSGKKIGEIKSSDKSIISLDFKSPNEDVFATGSEDGQIAIWKLSSPDFSKSVKLHQFDSQQKKINNVRFIQGRDEFLTSGEDGTVRRWGLDGTLLSPSLKVSSKGIKSLNYDSDNDRVAVASETGTANLCELNSNSCKELSRIEGSLNSIWFTNKGSEILTAGDDGFVRRWNNSGHLLKEFMAHTGGIESVRSDPEGKYIATAGTSDGIVKLWNFDGKIIAELKGHQGKVISLRFSPDSHLLATTGQEDGTIRLWKLQMPQDQSQKLSKNANQGKLKSVRFSRDGKLFATAGENGTVKLWDASNGDCLRTFEGHQGSVNSLRFSPKSDTIASADSNGTVIIWNYSGKRLREFQTDQGSIESINFNYRGDKLAIGAENSVRLWSLNGVLVKEFPRKGKVYGVRFSQDDQKISAAGEDGMATLLDVDGQQPIELEGNKGTVYGAGFSPDGKYFTTAGDDTIIRQWELGALWKKPKTFKTYHGNIRNIRFSEDSEFLAVGGAGGTVTLWNVLTGRQVADFKGHKASVRSIDFSLDSKSLITASDDGTVIIWSIRKLDDLLNQGCKWLNEAYFSNYPDISEICK